jgi:hypothetical protein
MAKLQSKDFLVNESLINDNYFNKTQKTSSIFMDFNKKVYYIQVSYDGVITSKVKMAFDYEGEIPEECSQFFVDSKKFLAICSIYDEIIMKVENNEIIFHNDEDYYNLNVVIDPYEFQFDVFENEIPEEVIIMGEEEYYALEKAIKYIPLIEKASYGSSTVFIRSGRMFSRSTNNEVFESITALPDMDLSYTAVQFILSCGIDTRVNMTDKYEQIFNENINAIITKRVEADVFNAPDFQSKNFIESYYHESMFTVNKLKFMNFLKTLKLFYNELPNKIIHMHIEDRELHCYIKSIQTVVNRTFTVEDINKIDKDFVFILDAEILIKALNVLKGENATIMVSNKEITREIRGEVQTFETPLCNIYMDMNPSEHIVFRRAII